MDHPRVQILRAISPSTLFSVPRMDTTTPNIYDSGVPRISWIGRCFLQRNIRDLCRSDPFRHIFFETILCCLYTNGICRKSTQPSQRAERPKFWCFRRAVWVNRWCCIKRLRHKPKSQLQPASMVCNHLCLEQHFWKRRCACTFGRSCDRLDCRIPDRTFKENRRYIARVGVSTTSIGKGTLLFLPKRPQAADSL